MILFLLNQNILPKLAKRKGYLSITGHEDVKKVKDWFLGEKKRKIEKYIHYKQKKITYARAKKYETFMTINVESIENKKTDYVYSIEVNKTQTLITSNGIIAHNCIGIDPYYLAHQATQHGYHPKLILSGREINDFMARHIVDMTIKELNNQGKVLRNTTVLLLGLTFKEDVTDFRNSRAGDVITYLKEYGIHVVACEPNIPSNIIEEHFGVSCVDYTSLPSADAVLLINKHKQFSTISIEKLKQQTHASLLVDIKQLFSRKEAEEKGMKYITL